MAFPRRLVTGPVYTPSGDLVVAGVLSITPVPLGVIVPDSTAPTSTYKLAASSQFVITTVSVTSLYVTVLESSIPRSAYYCVQFALSSPTNEHWVENWRPTGANSGNLPLSEILPFPRSV